MSELLEQKIKLLPEKSGVYVMLDKHNVVIYVGKAKNLKNRVRQYFRNGYKTEKVSAMVMNVADFYYVLTNSEVDALSLENNLIKKYKPKYNILLKDDKSYPYIRVNLNENFPRFTISRKIKRDGAKYFGPYMLGISVNEILDTLKYLYQIRPCESSLNNKKAKKECLNYHLGLCLAPCAFKVSKDEYMQNVKKAIDFLSGNDDDAEKILTKKMQIYAENQEFERALILRDRLKMIEKLKDKKITSLNRFITCDVLSISDDGIFTAINILFVRGGRMNGSKSFAYSTLSLDKEERLTNFIMEYYTSSKEIPDEILISCDVEDKDALSKYLTDLRGKKTVVEFPKKSVKKQLTQMSQKNADDYLLSEINKIKHKDDMTVIACQKLQEVLNLKKYPKRIECFDISHISGVDKVGSMAVFIDGSPSKSDYRKFKIKTVEGNNDFLSLNELLKRRLDKLKGEEIDKFPMPDLVVIDGGKGQLSAVKDLFKEFEEQIDLISLAEREEEIFTLNSKTPVILKRTDYCLKLLQRIRDEAHRFAITYNKNLRTKRNLSSVLCEIEGIGKKKRDLLMKKYNDLPSIIKASEEDLANIKEIGVKLAKKIKEYFKNYE